ncbi:tetratricopeptide repeat protein [bacterium]|nr:tetratricopeptide repeat protein [bacterium]
MIATPRAPRGPALLATLLACLIAGPAPANEASQAFGARALIAIDDGKNAEALALLDQAVAADPDDADVRYQRGVVRARSGDSSGAIEDLERALALRPYFPNAALELGIALVDADRPAKAEAPLMQAQQVASLDAQASFYLAVAQLRLRRYELARTNFTRAADRDPSLATAAQYYEGVIAFRRRDYESAESAFAAVQRQNPDTAMGRESAQYLTVIADERAADYSAFGTMALEYDSNVTLGPSQTIPSSVSGKGDWRYVINGGGRWTPLHWGRASLSVGYEFFQSVQFQLSDFNLTDNRPSMQLQYDFDWVSIGLLGRYDYYLLGGESYLSEATGMPWVSIREEGFGRTEIYARVQPRSFKAANCPPPTTPGGAGSACYGALNGIYSFAGTRQFFDLGNAAQQLWVGYQLGFQTPQPGNTPLQEFNRDQYQYGSWAGEVGIRWPLPFQVLSELAYRYEHQTYSPASGCIVNGSSTPAACNDLQNYPNGFNPRGLTPRVDNDHRVIFSLERPVPELWEHLSLVLSYFGTFNDSNKTVFTYDRNIGSFAVQVRY